MTTKILEENVAELQKQLQEAYKHINELNQIKSSAQTVVDAHNRLNEHFHLESSQANKLRVQLDAAVWSLRDKI